MKTLLISLLLAAAAAEPPAPAGPAVTTSTSTVKTPGPYARSLAKQAGFRTEDVQELSDKGLGRAEIVRFLEVERALGRPRAGLMKERAEGRTMKSLAEEAGLDYADLYTRSLRLRDQAVAAMEEK